jgi:hypothetical protein
MPTMTLVLLLPVRNGEDYEARATIVVREKFDVGL